MNNSSLIYLWESYVHDWSYEYIKQMETHDGFFFIAATSYFQYWLIYSCVCVYIYV